MGTSFIFMILAVLDDDDHKIFTLMVPALQMSWRSHVTNVAKLNMKIKTKTYGHHTNMCICIIEDVLNDSVNK